MNIIMLVGVGLVVGIIAIVGGYLFWLLTRPKKQTWNARVYTLSEGKKYVNDDNGDPLYTTADLMPYTKDVLEKVQIKHKEVFRLQRLKINCSAVTTEVIENWGGIKEVSVLLKDGNATVLKKGYDSFTGDMVFHPIPYDTQNMIENNIATKKARVEEEKGFIQSVIPWIGTIFVNIMTIAVVYMMFSANADFNLAQKEMQEKYNAMEIERATITREGIRELGEILKEINLENARSTDNLTAALDRLDKRMLDVSKVLNSS